MRLSTRWKIWFTLGLFANYFSLKSCSLSLNSHKNVTLVPSFFLFFFAKEIKSKLRSGNNESRKWREERENSLVTFASNLTFMQMTGSGSDPRALIGSIFFQTRKPIWLARLIVTTEGTLRIFTPHFASLYQGRKLFVCCTRNNICTGPRHVKARHISRFWHGCCSWKNIRRNFDLGT